MIKKGTVIVVALTAIVLIFGLFLLVKKDEEEIKSFENVWVVSASRDKAVIFMDGAERQLQCDLPANEILLGCLADIEVKGNEIVSISIKNTKISAKVLAIGSDYIELEGYGKVPKSPSMAVYKRLEDGTSVTRLSQSSIIVGYNQQEFIVGDGKICGALILRELTVDNIRILLKTTGFSDIYHKEISLTATGDMTVTTIKDSKDIDELKVNEGDTLVINNDSGEFERVKIVPASGEITINTISRSQGNPSYEGSLEIVKTAQGFVIINELDVEDYLKRVVPSEMPYTYGVEALKVQAICARSYAYTQLENDTYKAFGAHMDDSTQYQVYNNTTEKEESNEAIKATTHQILEYDGVPAKTFYYSTSWGKTSDPTLWGSSPDAYPYYESKEISKKCDNIDMSDEENFAAAIKKTDENDYEKDFPMYRWSMEANIDEYSASVIAKISERVKSLPDRTRVSAGGVSGKICAVKVLQRSFGGAITELTLVFEKGNATIIGENNIRYIMGCIKSDIIDNTGNKRNYDLLPSAYCIFSVEKNTVKLTGGGYGHGIGMSQNGVSAMANAGMKYNEILDFFYPGTSLVTVEMSLKV